MNESDLRDEVKKAVERYYEISSRLGSMPGEFSDVELSEILSESQLHEDFEALTMMSERGIYTLGTVMVSEVTLRNRVVESDRQRLDATFCSDSSGVRFFNAEGDDITPKNRPLRQLIDAEIDVLPSRVVINTYEGHPGDASC